MTLETARRTIPGFRAASGARPSDDVGREIRGRTTVLELLRMYPGGEAAALMARLHWPCAHCGGAVREPLTMAAKRHKNAPRPVLEAFRALETGGPSDAQVDAAAAKVRTR